MTFKDQIKMILWRLGLRKTIPVAVINCNTTSFFFWGAVDISLCDQNGQDYDMGTGYLEVSSKIITDAKGLTQEQKKNRALLKKTMENEGFKNYPYEWWHFCYGDRMWAAYSGYKECFYGMPSKDQLDG